MCRPPRWVSPCLKVKPAALGRTKSRLWSVWLACSRRDWGQAMTRAKSGSRNVPPDDRSRLQYLLETRIEPVHTAGQDTLDRGRQSPVRDRAAEPVVARLADKQTCFNQMLDGFFEKKGVPARPVTENGQQLSDAGVGAEQGVQQRLAGGIGQRAELEPVGKGLALPAVALSGSVGQQEEHRQVMNLRQQGVQEVQAPTIKPLQVFEQEGQRLAYGSRLRSGV